MITVFLPFSHCLAITMLGPHGMVHDSLPIEFIKEWENKGLLSYCYHHKIEEISFQFSDIDMAHIFKLTYG